MKETEDRLPQSTLDTFKLHKPWKPLNCLRYKECRTGKGIKQESRDIYIYQNRVLNVKTYVLAWHHFLYGKCELMDKLVCDSWTLMTRVCQHKRQW